MNRKGLFLVAGALGQVVLALVALFVFALGLGVGLSVNSTVGSALWVVALLIAAADLFWIWNSYVRRTRSPA